MEHYCSSYYDRNGLYNDGFPCPGHTYCCDKEDGQKMCCAMADAVPEQNQQYSVTTSTILQQIMTSKAVDKFYGNRDNLNRHKLGFGQSHENTGGLHFNSEVEQSQPTVAVSSISFLMSK
jgi:hypothetical protein